MHNTVFDFEPFCSLKILFQLLHCLLFIKSVFLFKYYFNFIYFMRHFRCLYFSVPDRIMHLLKKFYRLSGLLTVIVRFFKNLFFVFAIQRLLLVRFQLLILVLRQELNFIFFKLYYYYFQNLISKCLYWKELLKL